MRAPLPRRAVLFGALALCAAAGAARAQQAAREVERMSVERARAEVLAGRMVLVDIRTPEEWRESGIPDVATPADMRDPNFLRRLAEIRDAAPGAPIGLICATGGRSGYVAKYLTDQGVEGIVDVSAGMYGETDGWLARGLPVRRP